MLRLKAIKFNYVTTTAVSHDDTNHTPLTHGQMRINEIYMYVHIPGKHKNHNAIQNPNPGPVCNIAFTDIDIN